MNELQIFNFDSNEVRTVIVNEEPYFVGKDVAKVLGYKNTREALKYHVDNEDKKDGVAIHDSIGRTQKPVLINESGLYSLIFSSKLDSAKRFKRWVTSEVLPQIRKQGFYMTNSLVQEIVDNPQVIHYLAEQVALINKDNQKQTTRLETIDKKIEGEYVTPQDLDAIQYATKVQAEKFLDKLGMQITLETLIDDNQNIYEQALASKKAKEQRRRDIGKFKSKILVATKKQLGMKGNAPNNHIKRKDVDMAIQHIKDLKASQIEL
ncbi:BRO-N domain-containing protein [Mammaliicoccus sciuri]|uniref:BRO-N domain-containing protein n=1 Tax=Mammaliicoccus sciuri TaxID=1296 RepID=UPI0028857CBF|nr:Bro-N domain-containing protein [Mammaliicoccus sciuri]MDT0753972.1 Bro-N domain-containing protein [Mammaliicoccus sciuri]